MSEMRRALPTIAAVAALAVAGAAAAQAQPAGAGEEHHRPAARR